MLLFLSLVTGLGWVSLFKEEFRAWPNGPVSVELDKKINKDFVVDKNYSKLKKYNIDLTEDQKNTIDAVLNSYGNKDGYYLMQLTHVEKPWRDARGNLDIAASCNNIIPKKEMQVYYGGLCA